MDLLPHLAKLEEALEQTRARLESSVPGAPYPAFEQHLRETRQALEEARGRINAAQVGMEGMQTKFTALKRKAAEQEELRAKLKAAATLEPESLEFQVVAADAPLLSDEAIHEAIHRLLENKHSEPHPHRETGDVSALDSF